MLGVQDQTGVKDAGRQRIGLPLREHVEKIGAVGQVVAGLDRILTLPDQLEGSHHRGDLGDQPHHRRNDVFGVVEGSTGIKQAQGGGAALQRIHRMPPGGEALHHVPNTEADPAVHLHLLLKLLQLLSGG